MNSTSDETIEKIQKSPYVEKVWLEWM
jgi:hypothetical protein